MISLSGIVEQIARHSREPERHDERIAADFGRLLDGEDQPLSLKDAGFGEEGETPFRRESLSSVLDRLMPAPDEPVKADAKIDAGDGKVVLPMPSVPTAEPKAPEDDAVPDPDLPTPEAAEAESAEGIISDTAAQAPVKAQVTGEVAPTGADGGAAPAQTPAEGADHAATPKVADAAAPVLKDAPSQEATVRPSRGETAPAGPGAEPDSRVLIAAADDAAAAVPPKDSRREAAAVPVQPEGSTERKPSAGLEPATPRASAPTVEAKGEEAGAGDGNAPADDSGQKGRGTEFLQRMPGPVTVSTSPAAPAAAAPQPAPAALVAGAMEADAVLLASLRDVAAARSDAAAAQATHTLKIQLQPADLGMVNARLSIAGDAMTVALEVETDEAHRRLKADSEQIVKALRGLGFEVETVTIQQVAPHAAPAPTQNTSNDALAGRHAGALNSDRQEGSHREGGGQGREQGGGQRGENRAAADRSGIYI